MNALRRRILCLGATFALVGVLASSASAEPETTVLHTGTIVTGMSSFYDMVVGGGHIFLTPGRGASTIAVMNPDGSQAGTLDNVPGGSGAVIVDHVLYVAAFDADKIVRFDLTTDPPTRLTGLPTAPFTQPRELLYAGGKLWFTSGCDQWGARLASMNLDGSSVTELVDAASDWHYCTALEGNQYAPNRIFVHSEGVHPQDLYEYAVGGTTPRLLTSDPWEWGSYNGQPVEPLPSSDSFAMYWAGQGGGGAGTTGTFSMADMTGPGMLYDGQRGQALAVTARNGGLLAAGTGGPYVWNEVMLYRPGLTEPLVSYDFRDDHSDLWGGPIFSRDGGSIYVVTGRSYDGVVDFRVLDTSLQPSSLQIQAADSLVQYGGSTTISVHLEGGATNRDVVLMALPWDSSGWQVLDTTTVDANGDATFQVSPTVTTAYEADYTGDAQTVDSGSDHLEVDVQAVVTGTLLGAYDVRNGVARYHDSDDVSYEVHVQPPLTGAGIHVIVEQKQNGIWTGYTHQDLTQSNFGDATAVFPAATLGPGRYRVQATNVGTSLVLRGQSRWSRFVIS
jgi:hypothetical protein